MKIINRPRGGGKTTELIKMAAKDWLYIVCINRTEAERVAEFAKALELDIPFPITFSELRKREFYGKNIKGFLIDNADYLLSELCEGHLQGFSVSENR